MWERRRVLNRQNDNSLKMRILPLYRYSIEPPRTFLRCYAHAQTGPTLPGPFGPGTRDDMNRFHSFTNAAATLLVCLFPLHGRASTILFPDSAYVNGTKLVTFADPDEARLHSIADGVLTIGFSSQMRASTVGDNWASWGSPPNTESSKPRVLWSELDDNFNPVTTVTFLLSRPVSIFGFEAEPGRTDTHRLTATFFMAGQLEQTVSRDVSGNAGALLFAAAAPPGIFFDSVTFTSDADWAAGQFRYAPLTQTVPEPRTWQLLAAGLTLMLLPISRNRGR